MANYIFRDVMRGYEKNKNVAKDNKSKLKNGLKNRFANYEGRKWDYDALEQLE